MIPFAEMWFVIFMLGLSANALNCNRKGVGNLPGYCVSFNRGGETGLHWYTCCNNRGDPQASSPRCSGFTYQGGMGLDSMAASRVSTQCGINGSNAGVGCRRTYGSHGVPFSCGGCRGQTLVDAHCLRNFLKAVPGLCWRYSNCFESTCRVYDEYLRQHDLLPRSPAAKQVTVAMALHYRYHNKTLDRTKPSTATPAAASPGPPPHSPLLQSGRAAKKSYANATIANLLHDPQHLQSTIRSRTRARAKSQRGTRPTSTGIREIAAAAKVRRSPPGQSKSKNQKPKERDELKNKNREI